MRKSQMTYLVTMLAFAAGLWGIMRVGSRLHAARNVAGEWEIKTTDGATLPNHLTVRQSGRFLTGTLAGSAGHIPIHGQLVRASEIRLIASNPQVSMTATISDSGEKLAGRFDGAFSSELVAARLPAGSSAGR
jgi:hypothetical protein